MNNTEIVVTSESERYAIINGWVCEDANGCTCAAPPGYGHEIGCGYEPIAKVEDLLTPTPEATATASVDEALDYLDSIYETLTYDTYLTLHDLIGSIIPKPTVKPDRAAVAAELYRQAMTDRGYQPTVMSWAKCPPQFRDGWLERADAILALDPRKTEREVAEAAWDEACEAFGWAYQQGGDFQGALEYVPKTNPHRAKGESE